MAARAGDDIAAKVLIDAGADLDHGTRTMRWTALMWARRYKRTSVVATLLASGANPNVQDRHGKMALQIARKFGAMGAVGLLSPA